MHIFFSYNEVFAKQKKRKHALDTTHTLPARAAGLLEPVLARAAIATTARRTTPATICILRRALSEDLRSTGGRRRRGACVNRSVDHGACLLRSGPVLPRITPHKQRRAHPAPRRLGSVWGRSRHVSRQVSAFPLRPASPLWAACAVLPACSTSPYAAAADKAKAAASWPCRHRGSGSAAPRVWCGAACACRCLAAPLPAARCAPRRALARLAPTWPRSVLAAPRALANAPCSSPPTGFCRRATSVITQMVAAGHLSSGRTRL